MPNKTHRKPQQQKDTAEVRNKAGARASVNKKHKALFWGGIKKWLNKKLFGRAEPPRSAQQSIPYREMFRDGICRVTDKLYTKTVTFSDINYQLAQNEDKTAIFEAYCTFLNYFDSSVSVQLTFINRHVDINEFQKSIIIPDKDDEFAGIRREYADMLKNQLARGNNGLVKSKYITFGIEAASYKEAKPRLERIEVDVLPSGDGSTTVGFAAAIRAKAGRNRRICPSSFLLQASLCRKQL